MDDSAVDPEQTVKDAQIARTDPRDGSMADINVQPLPSGSAKFPGQAEIYAAVPIKWGWVPRIGVPSLVLRALTDRGLIETCWCTGGQQWRRTPPRV